MKELVDSGWGAGLLPSYVKLAFKDVIATAYVNGLSCLKWEMGMEADVLEPSLTHMRMRIGAFNTDCP